MNMYLGLHVIAASSCHVFLLKLFWEEKHISVKTLPPPHPSIDTAHRVLLRQYTCR